MSNGEDPHPDPDTFQVVGDPWSLIFARHPITMDRQGIWLFNQKSGEFWELVNNREFVLRPRQGAAPSQRRLKR